PPRELADRILSSTMKWTIASVVISSALVLVASDARAGCGFYTAPATASASATVLVNDADQVAIMREGTRFALTMSTNYKGPGEGSRRPRDLVEAERVQGPGRCRRRARAVRRTTTEIRRRQGRQQEGAPRRGGRGGALAAALRLRDERFPFAGAARFVERARGKEARRHRLSPRQRRA